MAFVLDGAPYVVAMTWQQLPAALDQIADVRQSAGRRNVQAGLLSMSGYANIDHLPRDDGLAIVLLVGSHTVWTTGLVRPRWR